MMQPRDVFDPVGGHDDEWKRLPETIRGTIKALQEGIQNSIDYSNPGKFRPTSGWRSDKGNRSNRGMVGSLHLWGAARDFVPVDSAYRLPPVVRSDRLQVVRSPKTGKFRCWHVQLISRE